MALMRPSTKVMATGLSTKPRQHEADVTDVEHQAPLRRPLDLCRLNHAAAPEIEVAGAIGRPIGGKSSPPGFVHREVCAGTGGDLDRRRAIKKRCSRESAPTHGGVCGQSLQHVDRLHDAQCSRPTVERGLELRPVVQREGAHVDDQVGSRADRLQRLGRDRFARREGGQAHLGVQSLACAHGGCGVSGVPGGVRDEGAEFAALQPAGIELTVNRSTRSTAASSVEKLRA